MRIRALIKSVLMGASFSILIGLTACSGQPQISNPVLSNEANSPEHIGTKGELIPIQSDNVQAAGYNVDSKVMTIQFGNGALYEYYGVEAALWTSFIAAQPHPWSQVGYPRLVQAGIPYKRIG